MRSRTFSFKSSLVKNNLRHSWPLWVCATLPLMLYQLAMIVSARRDYAMVIHESWALQNLGENVRSLWVDMMGIAPIFNLFYGCVVAVLLLQSLYTSRSVIGIHALPITRQQNWLGWVVSGFVLEAIPLGATLLFGTLGWLGMPGLTFGSLPLMGGYVVWMLCTFAWGFGFALFCGMFVGQPWALPVFTFILNFLGFGLEGVLDLFQSAILYGYAATNSLAFGIYCSPFLYAMSNVGRYLNPKGLIRMEGLPYILLLGAEGLVFMGLALPVYCRRPLERAGDLVVFRPFRAVFRIGFAVCIGLCGGVFGGAITNRMGWQILVYVLVFGALGLVMAQLALKRSFHFLSKRMLAEYAITFGIISGIFALGMYDGFGFNHWVPNPEDVASVRIQNCDDMYITGGSLSNAWVSADDPAEIEAVIRWHQAYLEKYPSQEAVDAADHLEGEQAVEWGTTHNYARILLTYEMKNGKTERRSYNFIVRKEDVETEGTMEWQLEALWAGLLTPEGFIKSKAEDWVIEAYPEDGTELYFAKGQRDTLAVVDALTRDIALRQERLHLLGVESSEGVNDGVNIALYGSGYQWFNLTEEAYPNTRRVLCTLVEEGAGLSPDERCAIEKIN